MGKRDMKSGPPQQPEKKPREFSEPVVLTPVQVLPDVARNVALRTRELVRQLTGKGPKSRPRSARVKAATTSRPRSTAAKAR
jgi:hypothetical protein